MKEILLQKIANTIACNLESTEDVGLTGVSMTKLRVDHDGDGVHDGIIEDIERCDNRGLGLGGTIDEEWIWTEVYWP